jgi:branched-chain amino acid transport system permease protein
VPSEWSNIVVGTVTLSAIYALVASGFIILFRATKVLSFAQGAYMLIGASVFYSMITAWHVPLYPAIIVSIVIAGILGWLTYQLVFSRMVGVPPFIVAIATIGLSTTFQGIGYLIWGANPLLLPLVFPYEPKKLFGTFFYNDIDEFIVFLAIILCVVVALIIRYTRVGIQMRAVADGPALAAYSGIHVTRISAMAWGMGAALAGAGGIAYAVSNGLDPVQLPAVGLAVFPVIILGGLDSYAGAFVGAVVVALLQTLIGITVGGQWQSVIAYTVLLFVLLVRPRGLFGSRDVVRI